MALGFLTLVSHEIGHGHLHGQYALKCALESFGGEKIFIVNQDHNIDLSQFNFDNYVYFDLFAPTKTFLKCIKSSIFNLQLKTLFINLPKQALLKYEKILKHLHVKYIDIVFIDCPIHNLLNFCKLALNSLAHLERKTNLKHVYDGHQYFIPKPTISKTKKNNKGDKIFICAGGTDAFNVTEILIKKLVSRLPKEEFYIIIGSGNQNFFSTDSVGKIKKNNYTLFKNVDNIGDLMVDCYCGVVGLGLTSMELRFFNIPCVLFSTNTHNYKVAEKISNCSQDCIHIGNPLNWNDQIFDVVSKFAMKARNSNFITKKSKDSPVIGIELIKKYLSNDI